MICRSMRYAFAQLARRHDAAFMQLYLPCSVVSLRVAFSVWDRVRGLQFSR